MRGGQTQESREKQNKGRCFQKEVGECRRTEWGREGEAATCLSTRISDSERGLAAPCPEPSGLERLLGPSEQTPQALTRPATWASAPPGRYPVDSAPEARGGSNQLPSARRPEMTWCRRDLQPERQRQEAARCQS